MSIESHSMQFNQIRIENTNHCGYRCTMCPREKLTRKQGFLSLEDFAFTINRISPELPDTYKGEFQLHGYGEPLLDKTLVEKVKLCRQRFPKSEIAFFTTLGVKVKEGYFASLASAGISKLMISCYGFTKEAYKSVHGVDKFELVQKNLQLLKEESENRFHTTLIGPNHRMMSKLSITLDIENFIKWIAASGISMMVDTTLHNFGDGRSYNKPPNQGICSIAWGKRKHILQITWDLKVIPCCFDYNAAIILGDLRKQTLKEIFHSEAYKAFIQGHLDNNLNNYPLCQNCERNFQETPPASL